MNNGLTLEKYSLGVGDRFARQAQAQLHACIRAASQGALVVPVWNKSHREHMAIGSDPASTRAAADAAVLELGWNKPYHVDADHIGVQTVDRFIPHADFYTIDVADFIGKPPPDETVLAFSKRHPELFGWISISRIREPFAIDQDGINRLCRKYLCAVQEAGRVYRHIAAEKGEGNFITEISIDETDSPQTPPELLIILVALADEAIPLQTIAPKFTGRFNKGVDYIGDLTQFEKEFNDDLAVIAYAVANYPLPTNLKLSVHSGSDKFSLYQPMHRALASFNAGLHLKTAGTTWLEEIIGLAEAGGEGLVLAKDIYVQALDHLEELSGPYSAVIQIDRAKLPPGTTVQSWTAQQFVAALRHDPRNEDFNPHLRQLLHIGYKIAAQMGQRYIDTLRACEASISWNVTSNLYDRHLRPLFIGP